MAKIKLLPLKYRNIVGKCLVKYASERIQKAVDLIPLFTEEAAAPVEVLVTGKESNSPENKVKSDEVLQESVADQHTFREAEEKPGDQTQLIDAGEDDAEEDNDNEVTHALETASGISGDQTQLVQAEYKAVPDKGMEETVLIAHSDEAAGQSSTFADPQQTTTLEPEVSPTGNFVEKDPAKTPGRFQDSKKLTGGTNKKNWIILFSAILLLVTGFFLFRHFHADKSPLAEKYILKAANTKTAGNPSYFIAPEFVKIEGGSFFMGNDNDWATEAESPEHEVHLIDFSISKYEVTVEEFRQFIHDTRYITTAETAGTSGIYKNGKWEQGKGIHWRFDQYGQPMDTTSQKLPVVHVSWDGCKQILRVAVGQNAQTLPAPYRGPMGIRSQRRKQVKEFCVQWQRLTANHCLVQYKLR